MLTNNLLLACQLIWLFVLMRRNNNLNDLPMKENESILVDTPDYTFSAL